jgi:hypothetical protein
MTRDLEALLVSAAVSLAERHRAVGRAELHRERWTAAGADHLEARYGVEDSISPAIIDVREDHRRDLTRRHRVARGRISGREEASATTNVPSERRATPATLANSVAPSPPAPPIDSRGRGSMRHRSAARSLAP